MDFPTFFKGISGFAPFPFQERFATSPHIPSLVELPTGLGKTATVILGWLWRRHYGPPEIQARTPRRLVYCLPMRVLVRQTLDLASEWVHSHAGTGDRVGVHMLMGGETDRDWDTQPQRDSIIVGTQDMLLSRALMRGYATSRFRWPVQYGLLNNDCLWVMDEIQLMGNGLRTTTQLQAFRRILGTTAPTRSTWMSATLRPEWLRTVDFDPELDAPGHLELGPSDHEHPVVRQRFQASKPLHRHRADEDQVPLILRHHQPGTLTLVVVNTVARAVKLYRQLRRSRAAPALALLHSRFRPPDRDAHLRQILRTPSHHGTIAVTTQVVEAGVDISATTLFTDLAPWPSMVQRFGRCNRLGTDPKASVHWFQPDLSDPSKAIKTALPYHVEQLQAAARLLDGLSDAGPHALPRVAPHTLPGLVLRRRDLLELFDTTPDLSGHDIDVSRFIREGDDHNAHVFWRRLPRAAPPPHEPAPRPAELCPVAVGELRTKKKLRPWTWDHLDRKWIRAARLAPGMTILLPLEDGCYSGELGWTGKPKDRPTPLPPATLPPESDEDDRYSLRTWQRLSTHTDLVVRALKETLAALPHLPEPQRSALFQAARWHDAGKAHPVFQGALLGDPPGRPPEILWGKSAGSSLRFQRRGFRHELASALAMLERGLPDLAAYLAASHHGKVRLSIRSLPHERGDPEDPQRRYARGLWDRDILLPGAISSDTEIPPITLHLSWMDMGAGRHGPSWLSRTLALRDSPDIGPFRLAHLEALLRAADWSASAQEVKDD